MERESPRTPLEQSQLRLSRGLGFWSMTALVVGNVVASGIFIMPAQLASIAGPVALVAWFGCAVAFT